jgi:hypothetical protein
VELSRRTFLALALVTAVSLAGTVAGGGELRQVVTVDQSDLFLGRKAEYDVVALEGYRFPTDLGKPSLPVSVVTVTIPGLVEISGLEVVSTDVEVVEGTYHVMPSQKPRPTSMRGRQSDITFTPPDPQVYGSSQPYPERVVEVVNRADLGGNTLAHVRISPVQYVPREGKLVLNRRIEYVIHYHEVMKEEELKTLDIPPGDYDYVIVTQSTLVNAFQPLADWKTKKGVKAIIVTTADVNDWYGGTGTSEYRSFVRDAHQEWGADWILLGGDVEIIPEAWKSFSGPGSTYGDTYYADYDDDWVCEVAVGRAPVNTSTEVQNLVDKVLLYERNPALTNYPLDVTLVMMDLDSITYCEESCEDYIVPNIPGRFVLTKVYDSDSGNHETKAVTAYNDGQNISIHMDHSGSDGIGMGWVNHGGFLENSELSGFTNYDKTVFMYTGGCHPGDFEVSDCFGEYWVVKHAGRVGTAFIGNAGYGWYQYECCHCLSGEYMVAFSHSLFAEGRHNVGDALNDHKYDTPPGSDDYMQYVFYTLNLLGDPEMPLWLDTPGDMTVTHAGQIPIGTQNFSVTVRDGGSGIQGARVCLMKADEVYAVGFTDASGQVTLSIEPTSVGTMYVTVTAYDYLPYEGTVEVVMVGSPYLVYYDHIIDDDNVGGSSGNGDGTVDAGETIELPVILKNVGMEDATGVTATLSAPGDPYVTITDNYEQYGDIGSDQTGQSYEDYDFQVAVDCPDGHSIDFDISIAASEGNWEDGFAILVQAPVIQYEDYLIDDSAGGNGNGVAEPGETVDIEVTLKNTGSGEAVGVTAALSTADPYIDVLQANAGYGDIPSGGTGVSSPRYQVTVHEDCPGPHFPELELAIETAYGQQFSDVFSIAIASPGFTDDMESGENGWTHYVVTEGYQDQWHMETYRSNSPTHSWKCGGSGGGDYDNYVDAGLVTPLVVLEPGSELTFWHWMDAEIESGEWAWDGGIVEISTDMGGTWVQIEPEGGYPYKIVDNPASPFEPGTPCFSGRHDWKEEVFDLSAYSGAVYLRFRFGTDGYVTEEGWYIDDVKVGAPLPDVTVTLEPDATVIPRGSKLGFTATVTNNTQDTQGFNFWTEVILPNGKPYPKNPVIGPMWVTLAPGEEKSKHVSHKIPGSAPLGTYTYIAKIGTYPEPLIDSDSFTFTVVE